MFAARNLQRRCLKSLSFLLQSDFSKNVVSLRHFSSEVISSNELQPYSKVTFFYSSKPLNPFNAWSRTMSTSKRTSMRSKVERRMQKESGKTLREIRRAKKLKKKLMTEEERLIYNLKRAKKKVALLLQKLKKYELPELPPSRHDPELLTSEQLQAYKKIGFRNKNYVPVGVRGVFGGVVQNMHLHWKFHETVQVCCDNFPKEKIKEMATMIARLSGGIVINIHNVKTIIMFRGRNYRQPKNLIPINTLTKRKALFKARFEQALESQKLNIKKIEQDLRRMGRNPEDPAAMASIQRVASTFFNAIDKKEGSPYVFREGKESLTEPTTDFKQSESSIDSDQEELDRFIAEIEDAADKEYEAEEAKEKEEFGRLKYWNKEEYGGRYRGPISRDDDSDDHVRTDWKNPRTKQRASDSDDEDNATSDGDDEWDSDDIIRASELDSTADYSNEAGGRHRKKLNNIGKSQTSKGSKEHSEANFRQNMVKEDSGSESMLSDLDKAMWESEAEDEDESRTTTQENRNYKSSSDEDINEYVYHLKGNETNGVRGHDNNADDSDKAHDRSESPRSTMVKKDRIGRSYC
ncbi:RNA-binding, CRM domain containing protein [Quillaja saponaria]|uniref:RNA-binding, CRM domain containing protein n=1 Tax=Quillaja saponaria TaxID=32244 RepID=A0AAD7VG65_QUISA|nr:RNA-binding, CRM domain containing protein [Quillaja saponaria]